MGRNNCSTVLVLIIALATALAQNENPDGSKKLETTSKATRDAVTIKLSPLEKRKKGDLKALVERFKSLPELRGASIVAASPDLLVLVPTRGQTLDQIKTVMLQQPEVYELEADDGQLYRREGDDRSYEQLRKERLAQALSSSKSRVQDRIREKLRELLMGKRKPRASSDATKGNGAKMQDPEATKKAVARAIKRATKRAARRFKRKAPRRGKKKDTQEVEL